MGKPRWIGRWTLTVSSAGAVIATATGLVAAPTAVEAQVGEATSVVESREVAFARTMADRDFDGFLSFISPEAVFFSGEQPLRGREEIGRAWSSYFEGADAPFSWQPDLVEVLESGSLALSSGPVLSPSGEPVGRFNTIWRREADGRWLVVFDKGS